MILTSNYYTALFVITKNEHFFHRVTLLTQVILSNVLVLNLHYVNSMKKSVHSISMNKAIVSTSSTNNTIEQYYFSFLFS